MNGSIPIPGTPNSPTDLKLPEPAPKVKAAPPRTAAQLARDLVEADLELEQARRDLKDAEARVEAASKRYAYTEGKLLDPGTPGTWVVRDKGAVVTVRSMDERDEWTVDVEAYEEA